MTTGQPIDPGGVAENSNWLLKYSDADMLGLRVAWGKMLRVIFAWSNSLSRMYLGK